MSSTRTASQPGPLRQERFASSDAYTRGLLGNLVAKRAARVPGAMNRELIWFLHDLSHRDPGQRHFSCTSFAAWPWPSATAGEEAAFARLARELCAENGITAPEVTAALPDYLARLCLDPKLDMERAGTPGFPGLLAALGKYKARFERAAASRVAMTATTRAVFDLLDYAQSQRGLVLGEGAHRVGKSYTSQAWSQRRLGTARYVQLSSSRDEGAFFRDIARGVGVACSSQMKVAEIRQRIEATLREQQLLLVLDEADWIWGAGNLKEPPHRVTWLLTSLVNHGCPVALIGSRNFSRLMEGTERRCKVWGSEQLHGRLRLRAELPAALSDDDLFAIAAAVMPEASERMRLLLVGHALKSKAPVPAIEAAAARARWFAAEAGEPVAFKFVEQCLREAGTLPAAAPRTPREAAAIHPPAAARRAHFSAPIPGPAD